MDNKVRFINLRPFVCAFVSVILGILSGTSLVRFGAGAAITIITTAILTFTVVYFLTRKYCDDYAKITVVLCLFAYLIFSVITIIAAAKSYNAAKDGYYTLDGEVESVGYSYDYYDDVKVYGVTVKGDAGGKKITARIKIETDKEVIIGTKIKITARFLKQTGTLDKNALDYFKSGTTHTAEDVKSVKVYDYGEKGHDFFYTVRHIIFTTLKGAMPKSYGTAYALITGESGHVKTEHKDAFVNAGVIHLLAVSGLHVGFLSELIFTALKLMRIKRQNGAYICVLITFLYVAVTGFTPSATRAFIITAVVQIGSSFGYKADRLSALGLSGIIILTLNFRDLFSVGFILSFTVYAGLILLTKPIENSLCRILPEKAAKFFAPYLAAYFSSLPVLIYVFKTTLFISPLLNILVIPVAGIVFSYLFCALLLCMPFKWLYFILKPLDFLFEKLGDTMGSAYIAPFIIGADKSLFSLAAFYLAAFIITDKLNIPDKKRGPIALTFVSIGAVLLLLANLVR